MKIKHFEELNKELETAIIEDNYDSVMTLVEALGENLNPQSLFLAIGYNRLTMIQYIALEVAKHNNLSLTEAFKDLPNPLEALLNAYLYRVNIPEYEEFKEVLLEQVIENIELFKQFDCTVSSLSLMTAIRQDPSIINSLLEHKNIDLESIDLQWFLHAPDVFKKLLEKGVNLNNVQDVIIAAINSNTLEIIDIILEQNIDLMSGITKNYGEGDTIEELNNELAIAIKENNYDSFLPLVKALGENLNPQSLFIAIGYDRFTMIKYIALELAEHNNRSLTEAFKDLPNPLDVLMTNYYNLVNNPEYRKSKELLLEEVIENIEFFKQLDCTVSSLSLMTVTSQDPKIIYSLLEHKNIDLDSIHLSCFTNTPDVFKKLLEKGVNLNNLQDVIVSAINIDAFEVIDIILAQPNIDLMNSLSKPLLHAISAGKLEMAEYLLLRGATIDRKLIDKNHVSDQRVIDFVLEHDQSTKEFVEKISSQDAYDLFKKAKEENDIFIVSYLIKGFAKDVFIGIKEDGAQKENIEYFQKNGIAFKFKFGEFIVGSQGHPIDESQCESNTPDIKTKSKTYIKDGKIYFTSDQENPINRDEEQDSIYVVSKKGMLYVQNHFNDLGQRLHINHSYFLKSKPEKELYGYGKPIACGGHLKIIDGKITFIDNGSGHYRPGLNQLKLVVKYLHQQGVLAENVQVAAFGDPFAALADNSCLLSDILANPVIDDTPALFGDIEDHSDLL